MVITFVLMLKVVLLDTYCHSGLRKGVKRNEDWKMDLKAWKRTTPKRKWTLVVNMTGTCKLISFFFVLCIVFLFLVVVVVVVVFFFGGGGGRGIDIEVIKYF